MFFFSIKKRLLFQNLFLEYEKEKAILIEFHKDLTHLINMVEECDTHTCGGRIDLLVKVPKFREKLIKCNHYLALSEIQFKDKVKIIETTKENVVWVRVCPIEFGESIFSNV